MAREYGTSAEKTVSWIGGLYRGNLVKGVPHGQGSLKMPDGTTYDGEWSRGRPHGRGKVNYAGGGIYTGQFAGGRRHGYGQYTRSDGQTLEGWWKDGHFQGQAGDPAVETILPARRGRAVIEIENLTFSYGSGKGIFGLLFNVREGEVFGYLGPNGSGKTTTIRSLLGFTRPGKGRCSVNGLDCWHQAPRIQELVGYLPGEIAFFDEMTGSAFLDLLGAMRGRRQPRRRELIERFNLDAAGRIRKMSKGMKQKLGLVAAFMHDPAVYILDEPTSGLDPLMQSVFIGLVQEEKKRGKTMLMSSHSFEETYRTCDRAGIIREGRLAAVEDIHDLKTEQRKSYLVTLKNPGQRQVLEEAGLELGQANERTVEVFVSGNYDQFITALSRCQVLGLDVGQQSLEQIFMKYYSGKGAQR